MNNEELSELIANTNTPFITHTNYEEHQRSVQLSFTHHEASNTILYVDFSSYGAHLQQIYTIGENTNILLTEKELKKLIYSFFLFEQDKQNHQNEQQQQRHSRFEELQTIARRFRVVLEQHENYYTIKYHKSIPLAHILKCYIINTGLTLRDIEERLAHLQQEYTNAQQGDYSKGVSNYKPPTHETFLEWATSLGMTLEKTAPGYYTLIENFSENHPFFDFWLSNELLTPGVLEYRLRYMKATR